MINFKTIRWKNLLSTGNAWTEIDLSGHNTTLIVGKNGHGKSTILDALTFVLFGKPFRKINKPSLINSVNQRDCRAEIEFITRGKSYKIIRGMKPGIFEIYCDGQLLDQTASVRDYQNMLETSILQMNYKSFTQIVILGSASFTPFMQLTPADRRVVIETILDIQIFSVMNVLTKQKFQTNRELLEGNRLLLSSTADKVEYIEKTITGLEKTNTERIENYRNKIDEQNELYRELKSEILELHTRRSAILDNTDDIVGYQKKLSKLTNLEGSIKSNRNKAEKHLQFYANNATCPTCKQDIEHDFREDEVNNHQARMAEYDDGLSKIHATITECQEQIDKINQEHNRAQEIYSDIRGKEQHLKSIERNVKDYEDQIQKLENADDLVIENQRELDATRGKLNALEDEKQDLLNQRQIIETALNLLKDGGIKTTIIRQYLPVINKLINKHLTQMGFFVDFNINENFEETIKSRYRDEFSYQNFSEGEKTRIDLAILFTWRAIAKMKNSTNTNLLILDEILDGSLDASGTEEFIRIIKELTDGTNSFIISHKTDQILDKFDHVYRFEKVKNFSTVTED